MADALLNKQFGPYFIQAKLGAGGVAAVYKAVHEKKGETVALKVLHPVWAGDPEVSARFKTEAEVVRTLQHPCIVAVNNYGVIGERPFLEMQFMARGSLAGRFAAPAPITSQEVVRLLRRVASALDHAHRKGVVHRDLKIENILLDERGEAYLSDFGIARVVGAQRLTITGGIVGTPMYMSPEQVRASKDLDFRSDLYSLAVVAFLLTVGRFPFVGADVLTIINQHATASPPLPSQLDSQLPKPLDGVMVRALAKRAEERYPSADAFIEAYARAMSDAGPRRIVVDLRSDPGAVVTVPLDDSAEAAQADMMPDDLVKAAQAAASPDEAVAYLRRALEIDPWHSPANRLLHRLEGARPKTVAGPQASVRQPPPPLERKVRTAEWEQRHARRQLRRRLGCLGGLVILGVVVVFVFSAIGLLPGVVTTITTLTGGPTPVLAVNGAPLKDVPNAVLYAQPSQSRLIDGRDVNLLDNGYLHEYSFEAQAGQEVTVNVQFLSVTANRVSRNVAILDPSGKNYVQGCERDAVDDVDNRVSYRCSINASGTWRVRVLGRSGESTGLYIVDVARILF